ncbi:hypothetical protein NHF50_11130 [Flavobacterium sp. NRK F10]|uniref:Uncharacterized protein n=1 Tax=Flavobacterium sediminis TaxID=2201181 RepID=A0A2U8QVZ5_9FLAO|nr:MULTISPECIES: hypothetical protein [Flavobacterium]AWM14372.1 hypothetical protein DI487_11245 [Flavobacterium sediminis]MCO6175594.1 hypothetical protein [Flavobacterium sp. NRK F10]
MKKSFLFFTSVLVLTVVTFYSCENNVSEEDKYSDLRTALKSIENSSLSNMLRESYSEIENKDNSYDYLGLELYNSLDKISEKLVEVKESSGSKETFDLFVENEMSKYSYTEFDLNEKEEIILESYFNSIVENDRLQKALEYEQFVIDNFQDQEEVKNVLITLSIVKYEEQFMKVRNPDCPGFNCWEMCVNICMGNKYKDKNIVDWVYWIATNPAANVMWDYASCSWGCY